MEADATSADGPETGPPPSASELMPLVYEELRALAAHWMQRERDSHTLQPTALVNEAYVRLADQRQMQWQDRTHFFAVAAEIIRRVLVDHARHRRRLKRGGEWHRITLRTDVDSWNDQHQVDLLALDEALTELSQLNQRHARVVELRFFGGLSIEETARMLEVSEGTIKNDWRAARTWLRMRIEAGGSEQE